MLYIYDNVNLRYKRITIVQYMYAVLLGGIIFSSLGVSVSFKFNNAIEKIPIVVKMWQDEEKEFSPEKLKGLIREMNFKYPDVIYAQAVLESGNFQSALFKNNKNLFGMRVAQSRTTTHHGSQMGYAYYSNWESSLIDRGLWDEAFCRNLTRTQYLDLLNKVYAEDGLYKDKILKIIKDYGL
jgi:hypothetical protein